MVINECIFNRKGILEKHIRAVVYLRREYRYDVHVYKDIHSTPVDQRRISYDTLQKLIKNEKINSKLSIYDENRRYPSLCTIDRVYSPCKNVRELWK